VGQLVYRNGNVFGLAECLSFYLAYSDSSNWSWRDQIGDMLVVTKANLLSLLAYKIARSIALG
jgi:hypothetical protein